MSEGDRYEALGVPADADQKQIHAAYRRKAKELHPDATGCGDDAAFREVQAAYDTLSDPVCRRRYDEERAESKRSAAARAAAGEAYRRSAPFGRPSRMADGVADLFDLASSFFSTTLEFDLSLSPAEAARGVTFPLTLDLFHTARLTVPPGVHDGQVLRSRLRTGLEQREIVIYLRVA